MANIKVTHQQLPCSINCVAESTLLSNKISNWTYPWSRWVLPTAVCVWVWSSENKNPLHLLWTSGQKREGRRNEIRPNNNTDFFSVTGFLVCCSLTATHHLYRLRDAKRSEGQLYLPSNDEVRDSYTSQIMTYRGRGFEGKCGRLGVELSHTSSLLGLFRCPSLRHYLGGIAVPHFVIIWEV
jgi:hypothetical protein